MSKNTEKSKDALPAEKQQSPTKGNDPDESLSNGKLGQITGGTSLDEPERVPKSIAPFDPPGDSVDGAARKSKGGAVSPVRDGIPTDQANDIF